MSWAVGEFNGRDIGYGVPATCDQPQCGARIDRGLAFVCGGEPYGGEHGCGLFFCDAHRFTSTRTGTDGAISYPLLCQRCMDRAEPFAPTPDVQEWIDHKETHPSWAEWRASRARGSEQRSEST
jgi:hypothetical protein